MTSAVLGVKVRAVVMYRTVSGRGLDMFGRVDNVVLGGGGVLSSVLREGQLWAIQLKIFIVNTP